MDKHGSGRERPRSRRRVPLTILASLTAFLLILSVLPAYTSAAPPLAQETPEAGQDEERHRSPRGILRIRRVRTARAKTGHGYRDGLTGIRDQGAGFATIVVNKYECLADYQGDKSKYSSYCYPPSTSFEFQVYGPNLTQTYQGGFP